MKLNGVIATIAMIALILSSVLLYVDKIPLEVWVGIFSLILGAYFGGYRSLRNYQRNRRERS